MFENLISPPVLFFLLGVAAVIVRSDLAIPRELTTGLSLYLMGAIGFRGGVELAHSGFSANVAGSVISGVLLGLSVPAVAFVLLTRVVRLDRMNAGAIAAHYGSISAVTFVTAQSFLSNLGIEAGGYMVAVMALMEAPGVFMGIFLARLSTRGTNGNGNGSSNFVGAARESLFGASVMLLMGSFVAGFLSGDSGMQMMRPLVVDLFPGILTFFLLDMGLTAAQRFREFLGLGGLLTVFGLTMPLLGASLAMLASGIAGLGVGDATLLATLAGSASYIAAPAAVRLALPKASPALSITLALGVTFPFNIIVGIPLYYEIARIVTRV